jgi:hypothetical protein
MDYNIFGERTRANGGFVSIILVVILLAILVSVKPKYFKYLFKSFLGNLMLVLVIIAIGVMDIKWGIGFAAIAFIIYQAFQISCVQVEGFDSSRNTGSPTESNGVSTSRGLFPEGYPIPKTSVWSKKVVEDFINFQKVKNPNLRFDLDVIQQQASEEEVKTLLKTGKWPWSPDVISLYKKAISENNVINNEPGASLETAQSVYNQTAIVELLSWNTKEGSFLLNGAIIDHTEDMPANVNNIVRCGKDSSTGQISMQKIVYTGYNGINGSLVSRITPVSNADIPKEVNGFKFLKSECNPCTALDDPADYSCPFSLNVGNGVQVSSVWQQLWGLNSSGEIKNGLKKTDALSPENVSNLVTFNKKDFPLLNELSEELKKGVLYIDISLKKPSEAMSNTPSSENIDAISGSSVPAIVTGGQGNKNKVYYGTKNSY